MSEISRSAVYAQFRSAVQRESREILGFREDIWGRDLKKNWQFVSLSWGLKCNKYTVQGYIVQNKVYLGVQGEKKIE